MLEATVMDMVLQKRAQMRRWRTIDALPSELMKQVVSYLAPTCVEEMKPGCKLDLQNASLAHSCLREWATEYLFKDMTLTHILPGASCNLERFATTKQNAHLLDFVTHIVVQVPPAIRTDDMRMGISYTPEGATRQRLYPQYDGSPTTELTDEQREYWLRYHEAMVEPFCQLWRWRPLVHSAEWSFARIFGYFKNLTSISVACCERVDHPQSTCTHTFIQQTGKSVVEQETPRFIEDRTVNLAWASAIIVRKAPSHVQTLQLSLASIDNYSPNGTVSEILRRGYMYPEDEFPNLATLTRLTLSIRGTPGTHGHFSPANSSTTFNAFWFWKLMINKMLQLQHLELVDDLDTSSQTNFSDLDYTNHTASVLPLLLPYLELNQLKVLRLRGFALQKQDLANALTGPWPSLERVVLSGIRLMDGSDDEYADAEHMEGFTWLEVCRGFVKKRPGVRLELERPYSTCFALDAVAVEERFVGELRSIDGVVVTL
ncbi:hypothetical protein COCCADRAFT_24716 [Bipolaris zeicola 26-R-13]|uniref:Uncharacterized protein n=1 Tax=Cochliobolus carbonum (strain 26-R-13) TaxID=930089 RepID=W6Y6V2_COCC2|nr:uncharacterized protein COCCADRAFT_24716 [Bipolaris zeicola 26-R-13]EUC35302.1 hypothetical protein COCCADRAFT_24716 [Bipolaris zeicola 26-R-13]